RVAVATDARVVTRRVRVAGDRLPGEAARLHRLDHLAVRVVQRGGFHVHLQPLPDGVDVLRVLELVDALHPALGPLLADVLRRTDAVHVVDDRPTAQRGAGQHGDRAVL